MVTETKEQSKVQKQELRLPVNVESFYANFADLVHVESKPENVVLHFIQALPGIDPQGPNAKVISSIVVTWPHLARMVELFSRLLKENHGMITDAFETFIKKGYDGDK